MQGDIFQMEQLATRSHVTTFEPNSVRVDSNPNAEVAIYNEDDLSHLLYVNHLHHAGHKDKVIINHVYRDGYTTPLESQPSGVQTPETETNETPVLSDCESDFDEGVYFPPSSDIYYRRSPLRFEDGFEFPVFLGRQAEEEESYKTVVEPSERSDLDSQNNHVRIAALEESHALEISGPLMSWWPEPIELMEHEWIDEKVASDSSNVMSTGRQVSSIEGPLMSWWPAPVELLEHEWDERFYE
ncbi:uncharacterized protein GGS22DRAFT_187352 [Annulohypoxylon maeteangense]|uniref:uncharacterized protein n=1 Tax=Annulohypoxylon maeteangense TaxID=1927788 RepID=UPI002007B1C0|nr:uncharacterized protein GGS22DRAFT_187352 [Annulohypoxylon maeteangense]KAI0886118.1 hypothetical protein GGS22DRAFT_187352 [Annulohypoxylon maeteangense]